MNTSILEPRAFAGFRSEGPPSVTKTESEFKTVIGELLPSPIVHASGMIDGLQTPLHPEEAVYVRDAVRRRVREFTAGRACARAALDRLGFRDAPVRMGARRQPLWPQGVVGSISHGAGHCIAAVCTRNHFASLGVDIEYATPLSPALSELVCAPHELAWCRSRGANLAGLLAKFLFSAKEAVFKCLYPVFGEELEFDEVGVDLDLHASRFVAYLSRQTFGTATDIVVHGRFACTAQLVLTSAVLHDEDLQQISEGFGPVLMRETLKTGSHI